MKATHIDWETDGEVVDLPTEVELPDYLDNATDDEITDYLSDTYGWLVNGYSLPLRDDEYDEFGLYVNKAKGIVS